MARVDRDTFKASVDTSITTNSNKDISGADVNGAFDDLADSAVFRDEYVGGKAPVRVATTASGTISTDYEDGDTVDGVTLATGDRILLKDLSNGSLRGVYTVNASGSPTRATDFNTSEDCVLGVTFYVEEGTSNGGKFFYLSGPTSTIVLGSTVLTFAEQSSTFNINSLSEDNSLDADADFIPYYDTSGGSSKKITLENLPIDDLDTNTQVDPANDYFVVHDNGNNKLEKVAASEVPRTEAVPDGGGLVLKILEIGDWDMDADVSVSITHGVSGSPMTSGSGMSILSVDIRKDSGFVYSALGVGSAGGTTNNLEIYWDNTTITLVRANGGDFDSTNYNSSGNRGWVTIAYQE